MKNLQLAKAVKDVKNTFNIWKVADRAQVLAAKGYEIDVCPMGSGGRGQVRELKNQYRIQVGYGVGRHNYATCVIIKK